MSSVNISFDTQTKELYVSINGNVLSDVRSVYINRWYDDEKPGIEIVTSKNIKEDGVTLETRVIASETEKVNKDNCEVIDINKYAPKVFNYR